MVAFKGEDAQNAQVMSSHRGLKLDGAIGDFAEPL